MTRVLSSLLCDVSDRDPVTFASVTAILIAVSALASYLPARRTRGHSPLLIAQGGWLSC